MKELISAISAITGSLITLGGTIYVAHRKEKKEKAIDPKCINRLLYVKVLHLRKMDERHDPIYQKSISRLNNKTIDVYDEAIYYGYTLYDKPKTNFKTKARSSGVIDSQPIHPWREELEFSDRGEALVEEHLSQVIKEPTHLVAVVSHFYNGIQPGNENFATKMPEDTECGRLVVDFSSLPNLACIIGTSLQGYRCREKSEERINPIEYKPGVYSIAMNSLKVDDVLRMDFRIDWSKV